MSYTHFSRTERLDLSILLKKGHSLRQIAQALGRNPSSVSREVRHNMIAQEYNPVKAQHKAYVRRKYSKYQGMKVNENREIREYIEEKMKLDWSPEAIAGRLKLETGGRLSIHYSGIYKYLYTVYGQHLCRYLFSRRYRRKKRRGKQSQHQLIPNRVFIDERPEMVSLRLRFGDYEGDAVGRPKHASPETLVVARERLSRKLFAEKVARLKYAMEGLKYVFNGLPVASLTLDNGVENVKYEELNISTYFCHPYSSWEKGSVEQGIKLLRRYIPKKSDLKDYSSENISAILERINNIPLKCLGWKTPNEVFEEQSRALNVIPLLTECCT